ncbi:MAG: diphosphate--fructose-6-phosphate 1-phosphotransferase [Bauldia sp.]
MTDVFVIAQGGGPTAVINQTVAGAVIEARRRYPGAKVLGARHGVRGLRKDDFIDLSALSDADLMRFAATPSAGLGSTRDKPDEAYCADILAALRRASARAFIYIGGNDTSSTLQILDAAAGGDMAFMHAPKTIDNDLVENDHTPGFISAAWFVAAAFLSIDLDFRAMPGIYVAIVMGRHAGFLTAASAAWRRDDSDGPHLIYVPERAFSTRRFVDDIARVRDRYGRCTVAMSEGVHGADGKAVVERLLGDRVERDAHGNVRLAGGDLGVAVQGALDEAFPKIRSRVDTFGYMPRGFITMASDVDRREAFDAGALAVAESSKGSASVAIQYDGAATVLRTVPLEAVAAKTRLMPSEFLTAEGTALAADGLAYFNRLVPKAPDTFPPFL